MEERPPSAGAVTEAPAGRTLNQRLPNQSLFWSEALVLLSLGDTGSPQSSDAPLPLSEGKPDGTVTDKQKHRPLSKGVIPDGGGPEAALQWDPGSPSVPGRPLQVGTPVVSGPLGRF